MSFIAIVGAAGSSGRYTTAKPTLTHTAAGQFTISGYDSVSTAYVLSNTTTGSRTNAVVSLSNANDSTNVYSAPLKLGQLSAPVYVERKAYTYSTPYSYFVQTGFETIPFPCPPGWGTMYPPTSTCGRSTGYQQPACCSKDGLPPGTGWEDTFGEWARIV